MKKYIIKKLALSAKTPLSLLLFTMLFALAGCETDQFGNTSAQSFTQQSIQSSAQFQSQPMVLREGNTLNITFPGSSTLDTTQQIRTDGKIVLPLIGEVTAAGMTPEALQAELLKLYGPQVATKQVIVTVQSPSIPVYVTGAVLRPGPVSVDHPITALEAVMEAGGFDYTTANLRAVVIVRQEKDRTIKYKLNLKRALAGAEGQPFYLQPFDIVYVPERFTWF